MDKPQEPETDIFKAFFGKTLPQLHYISCIGHFPEKSIECICGKVYSSHDAFEVHYKNMKAQGE